MQFGSVAEAVGSAKLLLDVRVKRKCAKPCPGYAVHEDEALRMVKVCAQGLPNSEPLESLNTIGPDLKPRALVREVSRPLQDAYAMSRAGKGNCTAEPRNTATCND